MNRSVFEYRSMSHCAYESVLRSIDKDLIQLLRSNSEIFTFSRTKQGIVNIRDFQTTGVVAFAPGCPFYLMRAGKFDVGGRRIQVNASQLAPAIEAVDELVTLL